MKYKVVSPRQIVPSVSSTMGGVRFMRRESKEFARFFNSYTKEKILYSSDYFETKKNTMVKNVLIKRGKRNRMFLHTSAMTVLTVGVVISPFISDSNLFSEEENNIVFAQENEEASITSDDVFQTQASDKPRDEVIEYTVQKGDTISSIGKKYGISEDTIKWANNLSSDTITVGDALQILPVTGIAHKVARGDTVYEIAKKYDTNAQEIVDFPFNDFANPQTFSLVEGSILIVPNGVKPAEQPRYVRRTYVATGPVAVTSAGFTWPVRGSINQFYSWYHRAIDVGADVGTPVVAAQSGTVAAAYSGGWHGGYGVHVIIAGENGYQTLYAHLSSLNVSAGDSVVAGKTVVGWVGMTGRTTGPHLHFEIRGNGLFDPLSFLR